MDLVYRERVGEIYGFLYKLLRLLRACLRDSSDALIQCRSSPRLCYFAARTCPRFSAETAKWEMSL